MAGARSRFPGRKTRGNSGALRRARSRQARGCIGTLKPRSATGRGSGSRRGRLRPWCGSGKEPGPAPRRTGAGYQAAIVVGERHPADEGALLVERDPGDVVLAHLPQHRVRLQLFGARRRLRARTRSPRRVTGILMGERLARRARSRVELEGAALSLEQPLEIAGKRGRALVDGHPRRRPRQIGAIGGGRKAEGCRQDEKQTSHIQPVTDG